MAKDTLATLWKQYDKQMAAGSTDQSDRMRFPSGVLGLDLAIGNIEGMTRGIVELVGNEAVGKTTLALQILAKTQHTRDLKEVETPDGHSYNAVYLDAEHTFDRDYAEVLGVDLDKLLILDMMYAQQQFKVLEHLLVAGIQFVIIDSIPALIPQSEEEKEIDESQKMADEANVLSRAIKRINALATGSDALVLAINQFRANTSRMAHTDKKVYGAWALRYFKRLTIELTRVSREDKRMVIEAFVSKNKMGAIGKKIRYEIEHGKGIDLRQHILQIAKEYDIVQEKGKGRWEYGELKAHGEQKAINTFPMDEIEVQVLAVLKEVAHESPTTEE